MSKPTNSVRKRRAYAAARALPEATIDVEAVEEPDDTPPATPAVTALPALRDATPVDVPTIGDVRERLAKAREFMKDVMKKGIDGDYAPIPYCGPKPVLLKPGAEKIARLFGLSHETTRTLFERTPEGEWIVGYRTIVYAPDGRRIGDVESIADSAEKTFRDHKTGALTAPLNTGIRRAQKRSYVAAIVQATGISDLFSTGDAGPEDLLSEEQRAIYVALYAHSRRLEAAKRNATRIKQSQWDASLAAAVDDLADRAGWSDQQRDAALAQLQAPGATIQTAERIAAEAEEAAS